MSAPLTSLLVRDGVVPVKKIEEAIQRQVISGGELATALLELGAVPENVIGAYSAVSFGLLPATREDVMGVTREVVRIVPREVAEQHRIVPVSAHDRVLVVAASQPLASEVREQLEFLLGMELEVRIAADVRIAAALAQSYAIEMTPRMRRLAERISQQDAGAVPEIAPYEPNLAKRPGEKGGRREPAQSSSYERPAAADANRANAVPAMASVSERPLVKPASPPESAPSASSAPRAASASAAPPAKSVAPATTSSAPRAASSSAGPPPKNAAPVERTFSPAAAATPAPPASPGPPRSELVRKHRGPMSAQVAVELLGKAESRDDILAVSFAFMRQFFDYTVMLVVHDDIAEGLDAFGSGPSWEKVQHVAGSIVEAGALKQVAEFLVPRISQLEETPADKRFLRELGRESQQPCLLLPVAIRQRVVVLFYGDRSGEDFGLSDVPEPLGFVPRVSEALQRLILRKKQRAGGGSAPGSSEPPKSGGAAKGGSGWPAAATSEKPRVAPAAAKSPASVAPAAAKKPASVAPAATKPASVAPPAAKGPASVAPPAAKGPASVTPPAAKGPASVAPAATKPASVASTKPASVASTKPSGVAPAAMSKTPSGVAKAPAAASKPSSSAASAAASKAPAAASKPSSSAASAAASKAPSAASAPASRAPGAEPPKRPSSGAVPAGDPPGERTAQHLAVLGVPRDAPPPPLVRRMITVGDPPPAPAPAPVRAEQVRDPAREAPVARHEANPSRAATSREAEPDPDDEPEITVDEAEPEDLEDLGVSQRAGSYPQRGGHGLLAARKPAVDIVDPPPSPTARGARERAPSPTVAKDDGEEGGDPALRSTVPMVDVPKVIVSMGDRVETVVTELAFASREAADDHVRKVLELGPAALPMLVQAFPGPVWNARAATGSPTTARELSPIALALAAFGDTAAPYLVSLLADDDADIRFYVLVTAESMVHRDLVAPLGMRLFDTDDAVASLAMQLLRKHRRFQREFHAVIDKVRSTARSPRVSERRRALALEALGELRDARSLRALLQFLTEGPERLARAAHKSLVALTRQDFGESAASWEPWVEEHGRKHRIEWLIDALLHPDEEERRLAGDELKQLTQEYFGYHHASPRKEREIAQKKYRAWWEAEGQRRFS